VAAQRPCRFIQPSAFANDKRIGSPRGNPSGPTNANALSGTSMTDNAAGWQDHVARVTLAYNAPAGLVVGRLRRPDRHEDCGRGPAVRSHDGEAAERPRRVNPLATTIRFATPSAGRASSSYPRSTSGTCDGRRVQRDVRQVFAS